MGAGHDGDDPSASVASDAVRRWLALATGAVVLVTLVGLVVLRPGGDLPPLGEEFGFTEERVDATVTSTEVDPCSNTDPAEGILCEWITVEITSGSTEGDVASFDRPLEPSEISLEPGDEVVLQYNPELPEFIQYRFTDFQRDGPLLVLAAVFVAAVVALGRFQGLRALAGLAISIAVLLGFVLPAILDGENPVAVALVGSSLIAVVALYLAHGVNERTTVALLGAFSSLALTGFLAWLFVEAATITGFASENAVLLQAAGGQVDVRGLVLAGIVIGSLGVLDDVTVTQVSAVWQLDLANRDLGFRGLYRSAVRIGRDHIASTVNTLVLAYAGAALPLLLIFSQADRPLSEWVTSELIATEVVRTLVGSIGLVAAVPITTVLAALVVARGGLRSARDDTHRDDSIRDGPEGPAEDPTPSPPGTEPSPASPPTGTGAPDATAEGPTWDQFAPRDDLDQL